MSYITSLGFRGAYHAQLGYWSGIPLPENAPNYELSPLNLTKILNKIALGIYPIKKVWGPWPIIIDYDARLTSIRIFFSDEDEETSWVKYYVYWTKDKDWSGPIEGDILTHSAKIKGLERNTNYKIKIVAYASTDGEKFYPVLNNDSYEIRTL